MDLDIGEFIYNADGEEFLVVIEETDDGYLFAKHGWIEMSDDRLEEYLDDDYMSMYTEDTVVEAVSNKGTDAQKDAIKMLQRQFMDLYGDVTLPTRGPHVEYVLDDT